MQKESKLNIFEEKLARVLKASQLAGLNQKILVAYSGGADSAALLAGLLKIAKFAEFKLEIFACHLDHGLREESADEQTQAREFALQGGLPAENYFTKRVDISKISAERNLGTEAAARQVRYEFFADICAEIQCEKVATAHHANDQAETVLFRIFRGTGLTGLAGIPQSRDFADSTGRVIKIIRPLLDFTKQEILNYLENLGKSWVEDASNSENIYTRNYIRNVLLPAVRENVANTADISLTKLAKQASGANRYINRQARDLLEKSLALRTARKAIIDISMFITGDSDTIRDEAILRTTALRILLEEMNLPLRDLRLEHLIEIDNLAQFGLAGQAVNLPTGSKVRKTKSQLIITI